MIDFLIKILGPFIYGLGVSEADFVNYMGMLSPYIYALFISIGVFLLVLITAGFISRKKQNLIRFQAFVAFVLAILMIVNMVSFGVLKNNISTILNASTKKIKEETKKNSKDLVEEIGKEGIVLLKNTGLLPLEENTKNINVFGWASSAPIYGGTGSGSSDASNNISILDSLKNAGYNLNEDLSKMYTEYKDARVSLGLTMTEQSWHLPEPTKEYYTDELMTKAKEFSDTALIVIGRSGGEGADLPMDMNALIKGTYNIADKVSVNPSKYGYFGGMYENNGKEDDFEEGQSYLELSKPEKDMIKEVVENFDKVVVFVNANSIMELSWVDEYEQIGAVLYSPGAGATGFNALGKIIKGEVNPSGKTVDTFIKDVFKAPYVNNIGSHTYTNVEDFSKALSEKDNAFEGTVSFVNYVEGIYVGYKFYETASDEGFIDYDEYVQYPFGYGLSYTEFDKKIENYVDNGDTISLDVVVTNKGNKAGKTSVQLYYNPPYTNGGIEKASVNLLDFAKTDILEIGATQVVNFVIPKEDMASYDSERIKLANGGYILEAGKYELTLREDSHTVLDKVEFTLDKDIVYDANARTSDLELATNRFDYARGDFEVLSRANKFENYDKATALPSEESYKISDEAFELVKEESFLYYDSTKYDVATDEMPVTEAKNGLKLYDLRGATYEDERWEKLLDQMSVEEMSKLINTGGWQTAKVASIGKVATVDADGPAGLNNFIAGVQGTAYPSEMLMSQTWNKDLLERIGEGIGREFADMGYYGWYAPAVNTHRSPFAGRNFEYFSEDGVLAGKLVAKELNGAAKNGVYAYIKHFALNDQETNRCAFLLTYTTEQALREIYLKPFEIGIKSFEGVAEAVMSSFNFIGTKPGANNNELLNEVLRGEWGFRGMVLTDYNGSYGYMISDKSIRNGNDIMLGFGMAESNVFKNQSPTVVKAMRTASKNILYTVVNSGAYANGDPSSKMDNMLKTYLIGNGLVILVLIALEVLCFKRLRNKRKVEE